MTTTLQQELDSRLEWAKNNPGLCLFPWSMIDIRRSIPNLGRPLTTCCCNLDEFKPDPTFPDYTQPDPMFRLKQHMDQGTLPPACYRCSTEEQHGGTSERVRRIISEPLIKLEQFKQNRSVDSYGVRVKFGNLCLQACRICHPHDSSVWHRLANTPGENIFETDVTDDPEFWKLITDSIEREINLHRHFHIDLMGGETLIQTGIDRLLDWCIERGYQDRLEVRITTSLSAMPADVLLKLTKFRLVLFMLSIDSIGDNYRYVRWPVEFDKIEGNLDYLINFGKLHSGNFTYLLTPVFSLSNIFYIVDYLDYWQNWFNSHGINFRIMNTNITMPTSYLDIQALPVKYRSKLLDILTSGLTHKIFTQYPEQTIHLFNFIQSTIRELDIWPDNDKLWQLFLKFTADYDKRTRLQFDISNDRLYNVLDQQDRDQFSDLMSKSNTTNWLRTKAGLLQINGLPF
jgi:hypothetical protein